jgi:murein L,D-transpeptidase YcbB/YkuD
LAPDAGTSPGADAIRSRMERLQNTSELQIGRVHVTSIEVLPILYQRRGFEPTWNRTVADQLVTLIETAASHGLDPEDYHLTILRELGSRVAAGERDPELLADYDVLLSDALLRVGYHAIYGKVDPETLDTSWNITQHLDPTDPDPAAALQDIIDSGEIEESIEALAPEEPAYRNFRMALARYREIAAAGGWEPVPAGGKLERGMVDARVAALRGRLAVTGDLTTGDTTSNSFDESVEEAVEHFQHRHRLDADGVVGAATIEALNAPVEARIDQIRVNLERARWVLHGLKGRFVLVDIAGFEVTYFVDDEPVWESRVQVGKPYRKTPIFRGDITYLEINPTWTVPPGILRNDILPKVREDVGYLASKDMSVIDKNGKRIDPASIDWSQMKAQGFPYRIVQAPGPRNALGRIKFMFPNRHLVFLHDTPSRSLFARTDRAFSSGCIRVDKPFELAELLLDNQEKWSLEGIRAAVDSSETRRVILPEPVPVVLLYWTIRDVYERDARVLTGLDQDFAFRQRHEDLLRR